MTATADSFPVTIRQAWWKIAPLAIAPVIVGYLFVRAMGPDYAFFSWMMALTFMGPLFVPLLITVFRPFAVVVDENGFRTSGHSGQFSVAWFEVAAFEIERTKLGIRRVKFLRRYRNGDIYLMRLAPFLSRSPDDVVRLLEAAQEHWHGEIMRIENVAEHATLH